MLELHNLHFILNSVYLFGDPCQGFVLLCLLLPTCHAEVRNLDNTYARCLMDARLTASTTRLEAVASIYPPSDVQQRVTYAADLLLLLEGTNM